MIVLRFENANGDSIYIENRSWYYELDQCMQDCMTWGRPTPHEDVDDFLCGVDICGFVDMEQLKQWFPINVLEVMAKHDIHLKYYRVRRRWVKRGEWQCVFNKNEAVCVNHIHTNQLIQYLEKRQHEYSRFNDTKC